MIGRLPFSRIVTWALAALAVGVVPAHAATPDIVLYASDVSTAQGNWSKVSDATAAGSQKMSSADAGWSVTDAPLVSPGDYFDVAFTAPAYTSYHVWLRMHASTNSKWNDSVWVQFSDAVDQGGNGVYGIGTSSGLAVNLATDASGSTLSGWGWQDRAYWTAQTAIIQFTSSGSHTIRVQTREDGVQIDQIVLSASTYLSSAPGGLIGDTTIVPKSSSSSSSSTTSAASSGSVASSGSSTAVPGTIEAENFDNGGEGVSYHDTTSGNAGGQYRSTNVDIEASSEGGYDVGWTAAGEWLNYTVNVAASGSYTVQLRVASTGGGTMHVGFNGGSPVWTSVSIPATGGWQSWQTVSVPVTVSAGTQQITILFDTGGVNLNWIGVAGSSSLSSSGGSSATPSSSDAALSPYSGSPVSIPGTVEAENFDNGGEGRAYHDTSSGNNGAQYRSTDVDIEASSEGGYDIGWTAAGEWLNYTVNVASGGSYTAQLRVASPSGGTMHIGFNGPSGVWASVNIPATGGWQTWKTISVPVTLGAGTQQITVMFDTGAVNLNWIAVSAGSSAPSVPSAPSAPVTSGGGSSTIDAVTWNIQINDNSDGHARAAMDALMAISPRPQLVVIEEAYSNLFNTYIDELQRQTGQTWHGAFATHCAPGDWTGSSCRNQWYQGVGIFSTYDITGSDSMFFPFADCWTSARVGLRAALNVNGTTLQVFVTHLQTGGCANDAQLRYSSMGMLKSWASNYSAPQVAAGDYNADPDQIDTSSGMLPNFVDTWSIAGSGPGYTESEPTPTMKIDYWFEDNQGRAQVQSTAVVTSTGSTSDHYPVRATFQIR